MNGALSRGAGGDSDGRVGQWDDDNDGHRGDHQHRVTSIYRSTGDGGFREPTDPVATPGRVSDMSRRTRAMDPTTPVPRAARRSIRSGVTRPATWGLVAATTASGVSRPTA